MRPYSADLVGCVFGRLTVVRYVGYIGQSTIWACECDCGRLTEARSTNLKRGDTKSCGCLKTTRRSLASRFWEKVQKTDTCWLWIGATDANGYGKINSGGNKGKALKATRVSWELHYGVKIPREVNACHRCDTPACVRPSHLFLGTQAENVHDSIHKGRFVPPPINRGSRNHRSIFSEQDIRAIRTAAARGDDLRRLAIVFNTSRQNIGFIVRRETWRHIE